MTSDLCSLRWIAPLSLAAALGACEPPTPAAVAVPTRAAPLVSASPADAGVRPTPLGTADAKLPPRRLLFASPDRTSVKLSPDGKLVSFLASVNGVLNVFVGPAEDPSRAAPITADTRRGIRSYTWAFTSTHVLYRQDKAGDEDFHVHAVDVRTRTDRDLTPLARVQARIEARSRRRPSEIVIGLNDRDPRFHDLYVVDLTSGSRRLLQKNDAEMSSFVVDNELRARAAIKALPDGSNEIFAKTPAGAWASLLKIPLEDALTTTPLGLDPSGTQLYLTDSRGRDTAALVAVDLRTAKTRVLLADGQADVEGATFDPISLAPQAAQATYDKARWHLVGDALSADLEALREVAHGDSFDIVTRTNDDRRWLVAVYAADAPNRYYRYDRPRDAKDKAPRQATLLFSSTPALDAAPLVPMHPHVLRARDGQALVSYLTLPAASDPQKQGLPTAPLPMVLLVHGGPWARDSWGLQPQAQWLASRGYAVLSVNYRGSTGFGKAFVSAADREWGGKMHEDLLDAVAWAESQKIAQPRRTAIMGGSYGGYSALVGLAFTPTAFACGVDVVGPSNLLSVLESVPPYWTGELEQFIRRVGDHRTAEGRSFLASRSPLSFAEKIQRPLLIAQGGRDPRAKPADTERVVAAIKRAGGKVTYAVYPDEGHGLSRPENRIAFHALTEAFLAGCLGGSYQPVGEDLAGASLQVPEGAREIEGLPAALP